MRKQGYNNHFDFEHQEFSVRLDRRVPRGVKIHVRFGLKNRLKSDMDCVTTRDPPIKSNTEFLMLEVKMVFVLLFSHGSLRVNFFSERFH